MIKADTQSESRSRNESFFYLPKLLRLADDAGNAFADSAGRYRIPLSRRDMLVRTIKERTQNVRIPLFPNQPVQLRDPFYPIPAHWQAIIEYLYQEKILRVPYVTFDEIFPDEPKIYATRLWANPSQTDGGSVISEGGYSRGVSYDFDEAMGKVIGELLERYPQTLYRNSDLYRSTIADLRSKHLHFLDPARADLFSPRQKELFPSRKFDDRSVFRFVKARSLTHDREAYVPAQMIYLNYRFGENEPVLRHPNSNGAGGMFTYEEAVLSGLYELIQRDAFLAYWLARQIPSRVEPGSIKNSEIQRCLKDLARYRLEAHILDVSSGIGVPAFVTVLIDRTGAGPAVVLGGGCGPDQEKSILRSLTEAIGVRSWLRNNRERQNPGPLPRIHDTEPFMEDWGPTRRLLLWYPTEAIELIEPFLSGPLKPLELSRNRSFITPREELSCIVKEVSVHGDAYEVFAYDFRHTALEDLGYKSVKVCVPALLPLYLRETYIPLGSQRIAGYEVNPLPHPFP
jgi:ribosomal protein S12 methylthiotransferase accessory factor